MALFPSHAETYGLALLEAMAAGVAVVATDVAGHRALLQGDTPGPPARPRGVLVAVQQPQDLAAAVVALLDDPDRATELGAAARAFAATLAWVRVWPAWQGVIDALAPADAPEVTPPVTRSRLT